MKWKDSDDYGFTFDDRIIYEVDEKSSSRAAGLCPNDRIIDVNGINISNVDPKQIIYIMNLFSNELRLLVVDQETEKYFKDSSIVIHGTMQNIKKMKTPAKNVRIIEP